MNPPTHVLLPLAVSLVFLLVADARAQLIVTTGADEDNGDALPGNGTGTSLREAVKYASPNDTITFANALSGQTISLTNGLILIIKSVTIDASALAGGVIINGHGQNGLFHCGSQTINAFIGLTLTGGSTTIGGGAILNDSVLNINQCTFTGNTSNEGGAIFNFATLVVNNSTLVGNHARFGGAIAGDGGPITLNHCTLVGNVAMSDGGAILNFFDLALNHCTVAGNQAFFAGGINNEGTGTLSLNNTIVAGNTASLEPQIAGSIFSATGVNITSGNPMLAPLGNYGGPTPTMPPLPGSPAIDPAGGSTNSAFATDQRGFPRVIDGDGNMTPIVDVGAVEHTPAIDLAAFWPLDWDGDGNPFGLEHALGTDPLVANAGAAQNLATAVNGSGEIELTFGIDADTVVLGHTAWIVKRSAGLSPGSPAVEIYRFDGPSMMETQGAGIESAFVPPVDPTSVIITDQAPPVPRAFYILGAELVPPGP